MSKNGLRIAAFVTGAVVLGTIILSESSSSSGDWPPDLTPPNRSQDQAHAAAWDIVGQAGQNVLGRDLTDPEHLYTQAVAWIETNYGQGWKGEMVGSNNWGAVQCPLNSQDAPGCIPYQDSQSSGEGYSINFRSYPSPVDGAADVVRHVLVNRPVTASVLADPNGTVFRASYAMRRERYYGGFCPNATSQYGAEAANASFANPNRDEGTRACSREAVTAHAQRAYDTQRSIAAAVGVNAMPLGTYDDAESWWASRQAA